MFTAQQIKDAIETDWEGDESEFYYCVEDKAELPSLGVVATGVDNYGGEGQGDELWVVFKVGDQLFEKDGYWQSWEGGTWDGDLFEVEPYEVTITKFRAKK